LELRQKEAVPYFWGSPVMKLVAGLGHRPLPGIRTKKGHNKETFL